MSTHSPIIFKDAVAMMQLRIACVQALVEDLSDALEQLAALSVSVEDLDAGSSFEQALFGEPGMEVPIKAWHRSVVTALFDSEAAAQNAIAALTEAEYLSAAQAAAQYTTAEHAAAVIDCTPLPDQDWVCLTQSQFDPVAVTESFYIVPTWHEAPAAARQIIRLDPGLAFGTGTHPTTQMCLRWIARHGTTPSKSNLIAQNPMNTGDKNDKGDKSTLQSPFATALDYGCGSGILAIAAAMHGVAAVDAVDIDPAAVTATLDNAHANHVKLRTVGLPDQLADANSATGQYDLVIANILASPLKVLAPLLCARMAAGGQIILAGVLERQTDELIAAYAPHVALSVADAQDGWVLLQGRV